MVKKHGIRNREWNRTAEYRNHQRKDPIAADEVGCSTNIATELSCQSSFESI